MQPQNAHECDSGQCEQCRNRTPLKSLVRADPKQLGQVGLMHAGAHQGQQRCDSREAVAIPRDMLQPALEGF